jgi:hypothetical protein
MADNLPLVQGRRYSFASIEISLVQPGKTSEIFIDVDDVSYSEDLEIAFKQGTNQAPLGWTAGTYVPGDSSLAMGKSTFQHKLIQTIGNGWLGSNLLVVAKYADEGEPLTVDELYTRIIGSEDAHSYGPDPLKTIVKLKPIVIIRNGITPLKNHLGFSTT